MQEPMKSTTSVVSPVASLPLHGDGQVGGEESEGGLLALAVLHQIEVHSSQDVPGGTQGLQEIPDRSSGL